MLRRGRWRQARVEFAAALAAAEGPLARANAAEGLAGAAWWMDDGGETVARYEEAYLGYRTAGDAAGAARAAAWLGAAAVQLRGEDAVGRGWLTRAGRLLEGEDERAEHGMLELFAGMAAARRGALREAADRARRAVAVARRVGSPDLEVQGMAVAGMALVGQGLVEDGMRLLDEAATAALAGELDDVGAVWVPSCHLVQGCEQVRDWERARQWCTRTMEFCRRLDLGSPYQRCRTHYGTVLLWQGEWAAAEGELTAAATALEGRDVFAAQAWARLGELRRRQGRPVEAAELFRRARPARAARVGLAELRFDEGDRDGAYELARRLLAEIGADECLERAPVLELMARAGRDVRAAGELGALAERIGTDALRASASWAGGTARESCTELQRAAGLFEQAGDRYGAARVRLDLAEALHAAGERVAAAEEADTARAVLGDLGARDGRPRTAVAHPAGPAAAEGLTGRQLEVIRLVALGLTTRETAERLRVSEHTVKRHIANILARLGQPSRAAAVAWASRAGLL